MEDEITIATREERIAELEKEVRGLHERLKEQADKDQLKDDTIANLQSRVGQEWRDVAEQRDKRIADLSAENNALRKIADEQLAVARKHRDDYDALCNELGTLGVDIPKLRAGRIKVVEG